MTAVTAALVGVSPAGAAGLSHSETSVLVYSERDRIRTTEAMYSVEKQLDNGLAWNLRFTYDGLTGASPTGASPSKRAQTITRPSGGGRVVVPAGALPIDDGFGETRFAVDGGVSRKLNISTSIGGGVHLSSEHDYKSIGLNGKITRDLDSARMTIGLEGSVLRDVSSPINGVPTPLTTTDTPPETDEFGRRAQGEGARKNVYDGVLSLTRVLGRNTLARLSYNFDYAEGYMTDPYKVVSVVQPMDSADPGEPVLNLYESRPTSRTTNALACDLRTFALGLIAAADYRFYWDDWGIQSHTVSLSFKVNMKKTGAIQPHVRWYHQNRATFSKPFLVQGEPLPHHVSADSRLATFHALDAGVAYSVPTSPASRLTFSIEWYRQRGDRSPPEAFGPLLAFNLFPDLDAVMVRVGLAHEF